MIKIPPIKRKFDLSIISNVGSVLLQQLAIYGISIVTFGIIARTLKPDELGLYAIVVSLVSLISAIANIGIKRFIVKSVSALEALGKTLERKGIFWYSSIIAVSSIAIISFIVAYILHILNVFSISNPSIDSYIFFVLLFLYSLRIYISGGLEGLKLFYKLTIYVSSGFLLYRILMIYAALSGFGVTGIMIAWCIGEACSLLLILKDILRNYLPVTLYGNIKNILSESLPLSISDTVLASFDWADRIVVSIYGYSLMAIFYVATTGVAFLGAITQAIYSGLLPHLSERFHKETREAFSVEIRNLGRYVILFTSPIYMMAVSLAQPTIIILVGHQYLDAAPIFQLIVLSLWITMLNPLIYSSLIAAGKNLELMLIMVTGLVIEILTLILLYPYLGLIATGISRGLLLSVTFALSILIAQKIIDLDIDIEAYIKSTIAATVMAILLILLWTYVRHISLFPIYVLLGISVYFIMLRIFKVIKIEELVMLYNTIPEKTRFVVKFISYLLGISYEEVRKRIKEEIRT